MRYVVTVLLFGILVVPAVAAQDPPAEHKWEVGAGIQAIGSHRGPGWVADVTRDIEGRLAWVLEGSGLEEKFNTATATADFVIDPGFDDGVFIPGAGTLYLATTVGEEVRSTYTALTGPTLGVYSVRNVYVSCRGLGGFVIRRSVTEETFSRLAIKADCGVAYALEQQLGLRANFGYLYLGGGEPAHLPVIGGGLFVRF